VGGLERLNREALAVYITGPAETESGNSGSIDQGIGCRGIGVIMRLESKVAIITGAGSGIGRATAEIFAEEGAKVIVADIDATSGAKTAGQIRDAGGAAELFQLDISNEGESKKLADYTVGLWGRIDILVNNAATFVLKGFEASAQELKRSFEVNILGLVMVTKAVTEHMKHQGGAIVNVGSISSFIAQPNLFAYSFTKAAILQLTRNMALDLAPHNIRVNCVCPGPILTPALLNKYDSNLVEIDREEGGKTFLQRVGQPREVGSAVLFLASKESSYITGASLMVDGGYTAQ
jgi:NAD(P)-dependent dehydrogenase (short-subunit alcohol dehydrogenase family)